MRKLKTEHYAGLDDHERYLASLDAWERNDVAELNRLADTAPVITQTQQAAGLCDLYNSTAWCVTLFVIFWYDGTREQTAGIHGAGANAARVLEGESPDWAEFWRQDELYDAQKHSGLCTQLALLSAWERFCALHGLPADQILRTFAGPVADDVEAAKAGRLRGELDTAGQSTWHEQHVKPLEDELLHAFNARWH